MKAAYKWLAFIIAAEVVVQAAAIAFGYARLGKYIDDGATLTKDTDSFPGVTSLVIHGINGMMLIPVLAIALLVVAFLSKIPAPPRWRGSCSGWLWSRCCSGCSASTSRSSRCCTACSRSASSGTPR